MAAEIKHQMSAERYEKLKEELEYLKTVRTKEVAEQLKEARSFGDLSENSEYDEAKTEQGKLYSKIAEFEELIKNAEIVENSSEVGKVGMGNIVTVRDIEYDEVEKYQIVGSQEVDPDNNMISNESPLGAGLLGHKIGEIVDVHAPVGIVQFEIINIEK
jgi:transcription elongation factor GreA